MGVLTDRENNPRVIATILQSAIGKPPIPELSQEPGQSKIVMHVCERLGYPDEKITMGSPAEIAAASFSDPNVVIIMKDRGQGTSVNFGLQEEDILHERGLITKDKVRAATLHKLRLPQHGVFWDVGAGSGSVSLEAALLCPRLRVIAVEKEKGRVDTIAANVRRFNARNVEIINGSAPDALTDLPAPDRVFIGGSSGCLGDIVSYVSGAMSSGIIVVNAASLETLHDALASLDENGFSVEVSEISVSRAKVVGGKRLMSALNPVFILRGEKG